jgi:hypothetical protein
VPIGSPVHIISSDSATLQGDAKVSAVLDQLTPGSTNFIVKAVLPNANGRFHSGMVVTGLVSRRQQSGVTIPRTAFTDDTQSAVQTIVKSSDAPGGPAGGGASGGGGGYTGPRNGGGGGGYTGPRNGGGGSGGGGQSGVIKTLPVTLVAEDDKNAVVEGLQNGQPIVINGQLGLTDGQPAVPQTGTGRKVAER